MCGAYNSSVAPCFAFLDANSLLYMLQWRLLLGWKWMLVGQPHWLEWMEIVRYLNILRSLTQPLSIATSSKGAKDLAGRMGRGDPSVGFSQSHSQPTHNARGPNWTKQEILIFIGEIRVEWDGRHNAKQPSCAKFVYDTMAWKHVLLGCMVVIGFKFERHVDQIINK